MEIIIVTGISGAGKSTALSILEDFGFYSMDNIPAKLIEDFINLAERLDPKLKKIAVGMDIRGMGFDRLPDVVNKLTDQGHKIKIIFLDAEDDVLVQRFKERRRPHPIERNGSILTGIAKERDWLSGLKEGSDYIIDTSSFKIADLKERLTRIFEDAKSSRMIINIVSFGFKRGILLDADLIYDVRFLPNPYYLEDLRKLTGKDGEVKDYIYSTGEADSFIDFVMDYLNFSIPLYEKEGKASLIIGIGCTGGKHRSVALAEDLSKELAKIYDLVFLNHRDERYWQ